MKTTTVTHNLIQLTRLGFVNAYLVREDDGFTLIDTTLGGAAGDLIGAAKSAGGEIKRIAFTHGHGDHVGSLDALRSQLGDGVKVLMPELDARILDGESPVAGKRKGSWPKVATTPDVLLNGGERVGSLEVVPTPGHTPGHVAFVDTRDRSVIAGDSVTTMGRLSVPTHFYWRFPLATGATWDRAEAVKSLHVVRGLEPTLLVAGHGPAVHDVAAAIDAELARVSG